MKKLMIAVTAAVCAIGAYAAEFEKFEENFQTYNPGEWAAEGWNKVENKEYTLTITEGESNKFLALETEPDGPLSKEIGTTEKNVFVDTKVKFTAFEDTEPKVDADAKIAVWLKTTEAVEGDDQGTEPVPATTNLMVTAGALNNEGVPTKTTVVLDFDVDPAQWYQLKIESVGDIIQFGAPLLGFKISINGNEVAAVNSLIAGAEGYGVLKDDAEKLGAKLFPALTSDDTTIKALALAGTGAIDDITIDATAAAVTVVLPISEYWTASSETTSGKVGDPITVTLTANEGTLFADGKGVKIVETTIGAGGVPVMEGVDVTTYEAKAKIGTTLYLSLLDAVKAAEAGATITLIANDELTERPEITKNLKLVAEKNVAITTQLKVTDAELTIGADITIQSAKNATILVRGIAAKSKLVVETGASVRFTGEGDNAGFAICGSGNDTVFGADFVINGDVDSSNDYAIYFPQAGTLTVGDGASIVGAGGIYAKSGKVEITGGDVIGQGEVVEPTEYNNGTKGSGYALVLETGSAQGGYANNLTFSITGGTFVGPVYNFVREGADPIAPGIAGGIFTVEPDAKLIVNGKKAEFSEEDEGYIIVDDSGDEPQIVPEEQGKVEITGEGVNAVAVITPNEDVTEITVNPMLGFMGKYEIPVSVTKITGVAINQLIIKSSGYDIAPACKIAEEGVIALNEEAEVVINGEAIPVKPVLSDATDEVKPLVVGDTTAVGVKTIPGLKYSLVRSETIGGDQKAVATAQATGTRVTLTDAFEDGKPASAFYVIQVTK